MTETEIMKALVVHFDEDKPCDECPYWNIDEPPCHISLQKDVQSAIDLINRKNAEIERLENIISEMTFENEFFRTHIDKIKAEAIKEFAERMKALITEIEFVEDWDIAQIAKEMGVEDR